MYGLTKGQASPTSDLGFETKIQTHGVISLPMNPMAIAIVEDASFVARSFSGDIDHLKLMMIAAMKAEGFALLDIIQPCVLFNKLNTFKWYRDRVRPISDDHDPRDKIAAIELALKWGDEIPIGVLYRCDRPSYESQLPAMRSGPLVEQYPNN